MPRSSALRKENNARQPIEARQRTAPHEVLASDPKPAFTITSSSVQEFETLRERLAVLAAEMSQAACDAAMVAAAPPLVTAPVTPRPSLERSDTMSATATLQAQPNVPTFNDLLQVARDLGTQAGQGKDTQIKFDLKIIEAAYLGGLSLDPNKHGTDRRDGIVLAEEYTKAQTGATMFDAKGGSGRKLISNIDKCIKLGSNPKWGNGEPLATVNALVTSRQTLRKDPAKAKMLDDAHNMLMRYATAQLKRDTLIDGDELQSFVFKKDPNERSAEDVLEGIRRLANNLKAGKIAHCTDLDNSPEVQTIINACTRRLTAIAKARGAAAPAGNGTTV